MNQEQEMQDEARENEPVETTLEEEGKEAAKDLEHNPDIEDPRLYSPLLDSSAPALKERIAEEPHEQEEEPETNEAEAETEGEEETESEAETALEKIDTEEEDQQP